MIINKKFINYNNHKIMDLIDFYKLGSLVESEEYERKKIQDFEIVHRKNIFGRLSYYLDVHKLDPLYQENEEKYKNFLFREFGNFISYDLDTDEKIYHFKLKS